ncbi:hypothetical protein M885DRAFT_436074 [Pelagophyceae sp. CCMP2097]|nr:hypothetical protein M885DRAFT_436074 [Pelagophyceae sp. CCMP2097]
MLERRTKRDESDNSPGFINFRLDEELTKAERILATMLASQSMGPGRGVLQAARGLAFLRVTKVGFAFSGRFGTGIVLAKLADDSWSAPSAIGTIGLSVGFQIGAQVADFLIVLNTQEAVDSFSAGGQVALGGQIGAVAGPVGLSREAGVAAQPKAMAPIYTYSISKGLFAGVSLEGSVINERSAVNERHYAKQVRAKQLLAGEISPTAACAKLHAALNALDNDRDDGPQYNAYERPGGVEPPVARSPMAAREASLNPSYAEATAPVAHAYVSNPF